MVRTVVEFETEKNKKKFYILETENQYYPVFLDEDLKTYDKN